MATCALNMDTYSEEVTMETVSQETNAATDSGSEKTFTQAELNAIVEDRLKRDRAKYSDYEELKTKAAEYDKQSEASKTELQKATEKAAKLQAELDKLNKGNEIRAAREKVAKETNVPAELLTGETEEICKEQAKAILNFAKQTGYPAVRDAGESNSSGKITTRDQFADWFNKQ